MISLIKIQILLLLNKINLSFIKTLQI